MTVARWQDHPPVEFDQDDSNSFNDANTEWHGAVPAVAVVFTAPTSGAVLVTCGGGVKDTASSQRAYIAPQVLEEFDGQDEVLGPLTIGNVFTAGPESDEWFYGQRTVLLEGLTPGRRYRARPRIAAEGGAGVDFGARDIVIEPVP